MTYAVAVSGVGSFAVSGRVIRRASGSHHYVSMVDFATFMAATTPSRTFSPDEPARVRSTVGRAATSEDWQRFRSLADNWRTERGITSSVTKMVLCPSYQRIIAMGEKAVPLILREMESEGDDPDHWFWALEMITGEDPVPAQAYGDTVQMAQAWLDWAKGRYAW